MKTKVLNIKFGRQPNRERNEFQLQMKLINVVWNAGVKSNDRVGNMGIGNNLLGNLRYVLN